MPAITNPLLACIETTDSPRHVTLEVSYQADFSPLERHLASNGLIFEERITIIGEDIGTIADLVLHTLPPENISVSAGTTPLRISRQRTLSVSRASLREDRGLGNDEIDARIEIVAIGLPAAIVTATTPELKLSAASAWE
jgi:hypothetical protein